MVTVKVYRVELTKQFVNNITAVALCLQYNMVARFHFFWVFPWGKARPKMESSSIHTVDVMLRSGSDYTTSHNNSSLDTALNKQQTNKP